MGDQGVEVLKTEVYEFGGRILGVYHALTTVSPDLRLHCSLFIPTDNLLQLIGSINKTYM